MPDLGHTRCQIRVLDLGHKRSDQGLKDEEVLT